MSIQLERYTDLVSYRAAIDAYLRTNLIACNQLFSITRTLTEEQIKHRKAWLARVHRSGQTCGIALIGMALPLRPVMVSELDEEGAAKVAAALIEDGIKIDGVIGALHSAQLLVNCMCLQSRERVRLGNHVLDRPPALPRCAGGMRAATPDDFDLIFNWECAFVVESGMLDNRTTLADEIRERLAGPASVTWIWDAGGMPVAMALGRPCQPIARIGMVYTMPEQRGHGYAGALVGSLSARLQAQGCDSVFLFTDMANPTSNSVYQRLGYRRVGELIHLDVR